MLDNDCSEGDELALCFLAGGLNSNALVTGFWTVTIKGDLNIYYCTCTFSYDNHTLNQLSIYIQISC